MTNRPMSFAVSQPRVAPVPELRELARRLEGEGFDRFHVADHLGMPSPFPMLAVAASVTSTLRVGTLVCNNDFWNPVLLAREAATLALLSDGRFELGVGAGHARVEYEAAGIAYDRPAIRVERLAEAIPLLRRLLDGDTVTAAGDHYDLTEASTGLDLPGPVPLLVGGNGDGVLALGAQSADIVGLTGFTSGTGQVHTNLSHFRWDGLAERIAHVKAAAGDRFADLELQILVQRVAVGDRDQVAAHLADEFEQPVELILDSPFVMVGSESELVEHCQRLQELGVSALAAFNGRGADLLTPVIARLQ